MRRKFKLGDQVVHQGDGRSPVKIHGVCLVTKVGVSNTGEPYVMVTDDAGRERAARYEDKFSLYVPPLPTEAGAAEYEEIMSLQETLDVSQGG